MIDVSGLQHRLLVRDYDIGRSDGMAGPRTLAAYLAYVAMRPMADVLALGVGAAAHFATYGILESAAILGNFAGQAAHESWGFTHLVEVWTSSPQQLGYEGRTDLGNRQAGDGFRYRGRGIFQITGRDNYARIGAKIGQPLESNPDLAQQPDIAVQTACEFWVARGLSALAQAGQEDEITHRINGGSAGIDDRRRAVARAKELLT